MPQSDPHHIDRTRQDDGPGHTLTVAASYVRALLDWAGQCGVPADELLNAAGLEADAVNRPGARFSFGVWAELFRQGERLSGDADFGLHVGEHIKPAHFNILGYLTMSCRNLAEAIEGLLEFEPLVGTVARSQVTHDEQGLIHLQWQCPIQPYPPRHIGETTLASWVSYARWISGREESPVAVHFQHPAPPRTREHRRLFNCPIHFAQAHTELLIDPAQLALPLKRPDPGLRARMDRKARQELERDGDNTFLRDVRRAIAARLGTGTPELEAIAAHFELSPRTLQRRLTAAGTRFNTVVDETRHELAHEYLRYSDLSLGDIAFMLGFSEQSAFTRAFHRWTGMSPGHYRETR